jgi:hypothetical protein
MLALMVANHRLGFECSQVVRLNGYYSRIKVLLKTTDIAWKNTRG